MIKLKEDQMVKQDERESMKTQKIVTCLIKDIEISYYHEYLKETLCYLYHESRKIDKILSTFLTMKNRSQRDKVFKYLRYNLRDYKTSYYRSEGSSHSIPEDERCLGQEMIKNLESLLFINQRESIQLLLRVVNMGFSDNEDIIVKLAGFP